MIADLWGLLLGDRLRLRWVVKSAIWRSVPARVDSGAWIMGRRVLRWRGRAVLLVGWPSDWWAWSIYRREEFRATTRAVDHIPETTLRELATLKIDHEWGSRRIGRRALRRLRVRRWLEAVARSSEYAWMLDDDGRS